MGRICVYVVSALFWMCLGEGNYRFEHDHHEPNWHMNNVPPNQISGTSSIVSYSLGDSRSPGPRAQRCSTGDWHSGAFPQGFQSDKPDDIDFQLLEGGYRNKSQCLLKCCELGPQVCQYLWLFKGNCVAVACTPHTSISCAPEQLVPADVPSSVTAYVNIEYSREDSSPPTTPPPITVTSSIHHPLEAVISPSDVITQESDVHLYAQYRSSTQVDIVQGSLEYGWELLSVEPAENTEEVFISGSKTESLHLSAMSPGTYTVQLTVSDTSSGLMDSTTTTVTVLPVPTEPLLVVDVSYNLTNTSTTTEDADTEGTMESLTTRNQGIPSTTTTDRHFPPPTTATLQQVAVTEAESSDGGYSLFWTVGVPVLCIVLFILTLSGCIVAVSSCIFFRSEQKRNYRYRKLIYTDT